jgi:hypothetical protein
MSWIWRLLHVPDNRLLWGLTFVGLVGFLVFGMRAIPGNLPKSTILEFELSWEPVNARRLMGKWSPEDRSEVRRAIHADFLFILSYVLLISGLALLVARASPDGPRWLGLGMALVPILAGLLDVIENLCLLRVLDEPEHPSAGLLGVAGVTATLKFALLLGAGVYVLLLGGRALWKLATPG